MFEISQPETEWIFRSELTFSLSLLILSVSGPQRTPPSRRSRSEGSPYDSHTEDVPEPYDSHKNLYFKDHVEPVEPVVNVLGK